MAGCVLFSPVQDNEVLELSLMACLPLIVQSERRKRIGLTLTVWLQMCTVASWFLVMLGAVSSPQTYRPRIRSYILDFCAQRDYVKRLVHASDETCIEQVRINRSVFFEELRAENVANEMNLEEGSNDNGCEIDAFLDEMDDDLATQSQLSNPNKVDSTFSKKKRKSSEASESDSSTSLINAVTLLGDNIRIVGIELSRSIASEMLIQKKSEMIIQEKVQTLSVSLGEIKGLTDDERIDALIKIPDHLMQILVFPSLPPSMRLAWVKKFISTH
ncbi:hypothetical protein Gogos_006648 [Gossypium gossypioides]|uniref:Uncharacterized protein n=1 Tax=Gossypium gossypioides TaxID=34282 RepID=A0A7J9C700_GOSGO|nr:hypothetical protein [Gossypium gossypioides]